MFIPSDQSTKNNFHSDYHKNCNYITWSFNPSMGLGNRMFIYASLFGLAKYNSKQPYISDFDFELNKIFQLTILPNKLQSEPHFTTREENGLDIGSFKLNCNQSVRLGGYRQSWKYFADFSQEIKKEFKFIAKIEEKCAGKLSNILKKYECKSINCILIGAHMRRGDFTLQSKIEFGHQPATQLYLHQAVNYYDQMFHNYSVLYLLLGNDYEWNLNNSQNISNNRIVVLTPETPGVDLCILTKCNHTIISAGSYGWWAGFLTGRLVTYMKHQCRPGSPLCRELQLNDYINLEWKWIPL